MNYRTAPTEQLRKERVRLTNMQRMLQQRHDSSVANRGGREAGFRQGSTVHQQERELSQIEAQLARLDAEIARRTPRAADNDAPEDAEQPASSARSTTES